MTPYGSPPPPPPPPHTIFLSESRFPGFYEVVYFPRLRSFPHFYAVRPPFPHRPLIGTGFYCRPPTPSPSRCPLSFALFSGFLVRFSSLSVTRRRRKSLRRGGLQSCRFWRSPFPFLPSLTPPDRHSLLVHGPAGPSVQIPVKSRSKPFILGSRPFRVCLPFYQFPPHF